MIWKKIIVKLRMWYADIRGHHGKRWNYEPGDYYMGRKHSKRHKEHLDGKKFLHTVSMMGVWVNSWRHQI